MKPSIALSIKSLAAKLHPPLPLNPRESQKLLNLLTTSFRQQLDSAHPDASASRPRPTDSHIQSILSSPLVEGVARKLRRPDHEKYGDSIGALGKVQASLCAPMEYFNEQVAAGEATLATAKYCLKAHLQNITTYRNNTSKGETLFTSHAGTMVHNWLWSSGLDESMEFTFDGEFVRLIVTFLAAEKKEHIIWHWFSRLKTSLIQSQDSSTVTTRPDVERIRNLLNALMHTQLRYISDANAALATFVNAVEVSLDLKRELAASILRGPGFYLGRHILSQELKSSLDNALHGRLMATAIVWCHEDSLARATLALGAPVPDPTPAMRFIKKKSIADMVALDPTRRRSFVFLCLRTSNVLLTQGKEAEALKLIKMVQTNFAPEVGGARIDHSRERAGDKLDLASLNLFHPMAPA